MEITYDTDPLNVFIPPFSQRSGMSILDSNHHKVMDFCGNIKIEQREEFLEKICKILNGYTTGNIKLKVEYSEPHILFGGNKFFLMRGWGYLTGCGGLRLSPELASKMQDKFAEWVVNKLLLKDEYNK